MNAIGAHLAAIARLSPHRNGQTVEIDFDGSLYVTEAFEEIAYRTPAYRGLRWTFGVHETPGLVRVFIHPDDERLARTALADIARLADERDEVGA